MIHEYIEGGGQKGPENAYTLKVCILMDPISNMAPLLILLRGPSELVGPDPKCMIALPESAREADLLFISHNSAAGRSTNFFWLAPPIFYWMFPLGP